MGNVSVPMSKAERSMLKAVSKAEGRSMAAWVRKAVGDAYASLSKTTEHAKDCAAGLHTPGYGDQCKYCGAKC